MISPFLLAVVSQPQQGHAGVSVLSLIVVVAFVLLFALVWCFSALEVAKGFAKERDKARAERDEARAALVEERHDSAYWRSLANWYSEHPGKHPSADECNAIAAKCDKWLFVGTLANPLMTQHDGPATYDSIEELIGGVGDRETMEGE